MDSNSIQDFLKEVHYLSDNFRISVDIIQLTLMKHEVDEFEKKTSHEMDRSEAGVVKFRFATFSVIVKII